jgi:aldehyde dehydrogenase (NAD+)
MPSASTEGRELLASLGVPARELDGSLAVTSPITGECIVHVREDSAAAARDAIARASRAWLEWRMVPAPHRGEFVRLLGKELRAAQDSLGRLITLEAGKTLSEGRGEVQEAIDICDFAVGLSRQLYGQTIASERPDHRMMETWHAIGPIGIITAFNFPVAVWSWNAAIALVCGDTTVWKPSEKTPLCALAVRALVRRAAERFGSAPDGIVEVLIGDRAIGELLVDDPRVPLISATGSTAMGKAVAPRLAARFARALLELGGNNAAIVCPSADLELTVRAIVFAAMGTAGQRCTTLRRLFVHDDVYDAVRERLVAACSRVTIGDPRDGGVLVGPLIDGDAYAAMTAALDEARESGGAISGGERVLVADASDAYYVRPAIVEMPFQAPVMQRETFAPVLYLMRVSSLAAAIDELNDVSQGLSASIFTTDLREAERFLSVAGAVCGIVNVNIGPSGAEIGGAFGGEKETGGGREAGSDCWKAYMRRATNTINYGSTLPLAQGVSFDVG